MGNQPIDSKHQTISIVQDWHSFTHYCDSLNATLDQNKVFLKVNFDID